MKTEKATFAGGCFWCMIKPFDSNDGIESVVSGYTGGHVPNPTYEQVCSETTGHYEAVQITFQPDVFPYEKLLEVFWTQIDPTDAGGQFFDRGQSYQTAIFYHSEEQRLAAEKSKQELESSGKFSKPVATKIIEAKPFYLAEDYHQDYYKKNPAHYNRYSIGSGRAGFIERNWGGQS
ncbi:peptide-methionine (S)-S-oxide reductase MsrA [Planococcus shenhongbingii]|uniref:peptide-methionine (S)-S-oxide reductase MsrA n=1 Tax=Planococcus shenhongbingii TaxID=3058398 RepID=UPI002606BFE9|nr:peptide-methionine (S)-S-oxide reductase MsrA [Planococcus sp. N016]WKA57133.1 peptide-methionine (S)-S-oxide reductase MsrA [Planococcus sp. N016]